MPFHSATKLNWTICSAMAIQEARLTVDSLDMIMRVTRHLLRLSLNSLPRLTVCPLPTPFPATHATKSSSPSIATLESLVVPWNQAISDINAIRHRRKIRMHCSYFVALLIPNSHGKHGHLRWLTTCNVMDEWEHETWHQNEMNGPQGLNPSEKFIYHLSNSSFT